MSLVYRLEGHDVVPVGDTPEEIAAAFPTDLEDLRVARTVVGKYTVSTVFLVVDYGFGFGVPRVFETATFEDGELVDIVARYSTWEEAEAGHAWTVLELRGLTEEIR